MSDFDDNTASRVTASNADVQALIREMEQLKARNAELEGREVIEPEAFKGEAPRYRLNNPCFLEDDTLHMEGEEIEYIGTPNLDMVPINKAAQQRMQQYIDFLTNHARRSAELAGRPFLGLVTDKGEMIAQSLQDARRAPDKVTFVTPVDKGDVPAMPHTPEAQAQARRNGRGRPRSVLSARPPKQPERTTQTPASILGSDHGRRANDGVL